MSDNETGIIDTKNAIIERVGRGFAASLFSSAYYLRDFEIDSKGHAVSLFNYDENGCPPGKHKSNPRASQSDTNKSVLWWSGLDGLAGEGRFVVECIRYRITGGSRANRNDYVGNTVMRVRLGSSIIWPMAPLSLFWSEHSRDTVEGVLFLPAERRLALHYYHNWDLTLQTESSVTFEADMKIQVQLLGSKMVVAANMWCNPSGMNSQGFVDTTKLVAATDAPSAA